jgi:hypothetical protein
MPGVRFRMKLHSLGTLSVSLTIYIYIYIYIYIASNGETNA